MRTRPSMSPVKIPCSRALPDYCTPVCCSLGVDKLGFTPKNLHTISACLKSPAVANSARSEPRVVANYAHKLGATFREVVDVQALLLAATRPSLESSACRAVFSL